MDIEQEVIANEAMTIFLNPRISCRAPEGKKTLRDICLEQFS